jgi:hypothetical protein
MITSVSCRTRIYCIPGLSLCRHTAAHDFAEAAAPACDLAGRAAAQFVVSRLEVWMMA